MTIHDKLNLLGETTFLLPRPLWLDIALILQNIQTYVQNGDAEQIHSTPKTVFLPCLQVFHKVLHISAIVHKQKFGITTMSHLQPISPLCWFRSIASFWFTPCHPYRTTFHLSYLRQLHRNRCCKWLRRVPWKTADVTAHARIKAEKHKPLL
jgi:hypothetical protein